MRGRIHSLQRSPGGVPKLPVERVSITEAGLDGDWQRDRRHHGGPDRALCLFSREVIDALAAEGHPIHPGAAGENVTVEGLPWAEVRPGVRLALGEVLAEITDFAPPCRTIQGCFSDRRFSRISEATHPGRSRVYARVLRGGTVQPGDPVELMPPRIP